MSQISKQALIVDNSQSFPNNNAGEITPSDLRGFNVNMIDSLVDEISYQSFTASVTNSINLLNAFTSSQQPSFNDLNAFTASQLTINTGYNAATYSLNTSVNTLSAEIDQLQTWSGSVNEIRFNNGIPQYATRWNFGGFISASFVPNIDGLIADITVLNDPSKLNTSSFNDYTASTAATQSIFSASVATSFSQSNATFTEFSSSQNDFNQSATASLVELLNLSSSLSGGYATQGELDASSSTLQNNINVVNGRVDTLSSFTGSYATTGSNTFIGNQILTGSLIISSSAAVDLQVTGAIGASGNIVSSGSLGQAIHSNVALSITSNAQTSSATFGRNVMLQRSGSNGIGLAGSPAQGNYVAGLTNPSLIVFSGSIDINGNYYAPIQFQKGLEYTDGRVTFTTPINASAGLIGNTRVTGSITITGSAYGNVVSASIVSSTASIDLSAANYFTLTIASDTNINVTNPQPGVTATLVINTAGATTASFSSNVKQSSGSFYVPSVSGNIDILSFTAVTTSSVYVVPAYTFV